MWSCGFRRPGRGPFPVALAGMRAAAASTSRAVAVPQIVLADRWKAEGGVQAAEATGQGELDAAVR